LKANSTLENYELFYRKINKKFKLINAKNRFYLPDSHEINLDSIKNILEYPL